MSDTINAKIHEENLRLRLTLLSYARIFVVESFGYESEQDAGEAAREVLGYPEHDPECAYHNGIHEPSHWDTEKDEAVYGREVNQGTCTCGLHEKMDAEADMIMKILGISDETTSLPSV